MSAVGIITTGKKLCWATILAFSVSFLWCHSNCVGLNTSKLLKLAGIEGNSLQGNSVSGFDCKCPYTRHWRFTLEEWRLSKRMIMLGSCTFLMGSNASVAIRGDKETPIRTVEIEEPFWIDKTEVTTSEFMKFFRATKYKTTAEELGTSFVFSPKDPRLTNSASSTSTLTNAIDARTGIGTGGWWIEKKSVTWASDLKSRRSHPLNPVTHVSWQDGFSYCLWLQGSLPTESQWEFACRGGLKQCLYPWGNLLKPNGTHMTNIWQGQFPLKNTVEDGFETSSPVGSFPPNGYGLYDMVGNVWEWVKDSWNMYSPEIRLQKGGSFMCHRIHCFRYRCGARTKASQDSTSSNVGFRCVHRVHL